MNDSPDRIVSLDEATDLGVAEGDPDVRGWEVMAEDGRRIGEVEDLLIDPGEMKVRYLDVEVDEELFGGAAGRHILIPVEKTKLDEIDDRLRVDGLESRRVIDLPPYRDGDLTDAFERDIAAFFGGEGEAPGQ